MHIISMHKENPLENFKLIKEILGMIKKLLTITKIQEMWDLSIKMMKMSELV